MMCAWVFFFLLRCLKYCWFEPNRVQIYQSGYSLITQPLNILHSSFVKSKLRSWHEKKNRWLFESPLEDYSSCDIWYGRISNRKKKEWKIQIRLARLSQSFGVSVTKERKIMSIDLDCSERQWFSMLDIISSQRAKQQLRAEALELLYLQRQNENMLELINSPKSRWHWIPSWLPLHGIHSESQSSKSLFYLLHWIKSRMLIIICVASVCTKINR